MSNAFCFLFSKFGPIWGWASWANRWAEYDVKMKSWPETKKNRSTALLGESEKEVNWRIDLFDKMYKGEIDTWDYQWAYAKIINKGLSIIPSLNLIENIGFGSTATHTKGTINEKHKRRHSLSSLVHPVNLYRNTDFDKRFLNEFALKKFNVFKAIIAVMKKISKITG